MDEKQIETVIGNLKNNKLILNNNDYRRSLISYLKLKPEKLTESKLMVLLGERESTDFINVFRQGIAELMTMFYFSKKGINFEIEKNVNSENDSNVDVLVNLESSFTVNIEIKCPVIPDDDFDGGISGRLSYRFTNDKDGVLDFINDFNSMLDGASKKSGKKGSKISLPLDNKIKDTLLSCQNKFPNPNRNKINCLWINTTNREMVSYWDYLSNEMETGFFDGKSFLPHKDFNKVNAVILTNGLELNEKYVEESWDLDRCCIVILCNRFSENYSELVTCGAFKKLCDLVPNQTLNFVNYMAINEKKGKDKLPLTNLKIELIYPWKFK